MGNDKPSTQDPFFLAEIALMMSPAPTTAQVKAIELRGDD